MLPWRSGSSFTLITAALAVLNAVVAVLAAIRHRALNRVWRVLAWSTLVYFLWLSWQIISSALYLSRIYGSLGQGIALLMVLALILFGGLTLPVAIWWFIRHRRAAGKQQVIAATVLLSLFVVAIGIAAIRDYTASRSFPTPPGDAQALASLVRLALPLPESLPAAKSEKPSLLEAPVARCSELERGGAVAAISFVTRGDQPAIASECLQAEPTKLLERVASVVRRRAARGPIKVDLFRSVRALRPQPGPLGPLADSLAVRPGLDGVCFGERCLMPWQLVAHGLFAQNTPLPYADQLQMGVGLGIVRRLLGAGAAPDANGLFLIQTHSLLVDASGKARAFPRGVQVKRLPTRDNLEAAVHAAKAHILRAQRRDGGFRYQLDMFSGESIDENPSIARHAGTLLVMCELAGDGRANRRLAERALAKLASWERPHQQFSALLRYPEEREADLGASALGLVALASCRHLAGERYDALMGRLTRFILELEDEAGQFHPAFDLKHDRIIRGPTPLFAGGQAIFALSLLEAIARDGAATSELPTSGELSKAVELAMDHVAKEYWPRPLSDFFYLKENWHCLAARASLGHHRHEGYERFCLDYVEFKTQRFIVDEASRVDPDFYGGFNFSNLVPPHNGSTAGVGEALAAAIEITRMRGEDATILERRLERVLGFLLQRQLLEDNCFACAKPRLSRGGFTGESVGTTGRIDHTQHALAALGHGARQLFAEEARRSPARD